jgi:hypothetical protein
VSAQQHGDPSTREPFVYNGLDVYVGNWIADTDQGRSLKIIGIVSRSINTVVVTVEDVDRYNTFLDVNGIGIFPTPSSVVIFEINGMRLPILNPLPSTLADFTFSQEVLGRFNNNNPLFRQRVFQSGHGLQDNVSIWVDPADGLFKPVSSDAELQRMVGTVDRTGPGIDVFYFIPTTRVVEGIDPPLPGSAGDLIYVDPTTGNLSTTPGTTSKVAYIQLTDSTPDVTDSTLTTVNVGSVLGINSVPVTFSGSTLTSVVSDVNGTTSQHDVTAQELPTPTSVSSVPGNLLYGVVANIGTTTQATINGTLVTFNDVTNGTIEFGSAIANAADMANTINAAGITDISAVGVGSSSLTIQNASGGPITIVNVTNDTSGTPFAGPASGSGVPLSTPASSGTFIRFTNADGSGIIFTNETGTPVFDLGLQSVRNGALPSGLVVEQFAVTPGSGGVTVYNTLGDRPAMGTVGEQAYVIDNDDGAGNNAGEWALYIWDGFGWVQTGNEDSTATDARSLTATITNASGLTTLIGTLSNGRRVTSVVVEVTSVFDGTPTLEIGDITDTDSLMPDAFIDLSSVGAYEANPDFIYQTGNDVDINATFTAGGATTGSATIIVTYV